MARLSLARTEENRVCGVNGLCEGAGSEAGVGGKAAITRFAGGSDGRSRARYPGAVFENNEKRGSGSRRTGIKHF